MFCFDSKASLYLCKDTVLPKNSYDFTRLLSVPSEYEDVRKSTVTVTVPTCALAGCSPSDAHTPQGCASPTNPAGDRLLARALPRPPEHLPAGPQLGVPLLSRLGPRVSQGPVSPGAACRPRASDSAWQGGKSLSGQIVP